MLWSGIRVSAGRSAFRRRSDSPRLFKKHPDGVVGRHLREPVLADEVPYEVVPGRRLNLLGRSYLLDSPFPQNGDAVGDTDRLVHVVGDEDDGLPEIFLQRYQLVLQRLAADRIERSERLVHQDDLRIGRQRAENADALLLPAAQLVGETVAVAFGRKSGHLKQFVRPAPHFRRRPSEQLGNDVDILRHGEVRKERDLLDHVPDTATERHSIARPDILPADDDAPGRRFFEAVDHLERRRLAAPRRTDEADQLPPANVEVQHVDRPRSVRVDLADIREDDAVS